MPAWRSRPYPCTKWSTVRLLVNLPARDLLYLLKLVSFCFWMCLLMIQWRIQTKMKVRRLQNLESWVELKNNGSNLHFVPYSSDLPFLLISSCDCNSLMAKRLIGMSTPTEGEAEAWKMNLSRLDERKKKGTGTNICRKPQKCALPVLFV